MNPLDLLSSLLTQAASASPVVLNQNTDIDEQLARLKMSSKAGGRAYEPRDLQVEAVTRFRAKPQFESLREARLVSFGLGIDVPGSKGCLMEDRRLFRAALTGVDEWGKEPRQFRKCYQGLMRSYFDYDGLGRGIPDEGGENWADLRAYLSDRAPHIVDKDMNPDWVTCARENPELVSATPCAGLAREISADREARVKYVRSMLGIDDASWFTREFILAQIQQATQLPHAEFRNAVVGLLRLLGSNEVLQDRGLQLILDRYALIPQTPQHASLKDKAVHAWGNPWLPSNKDRWGGVSEAAKSMVSVWLNLEYIDLFFGKLAQDGIGDTRRVNFWRKYVQSIQSVHFALGSNAMYSHERDFKEIRTKLKGLLVNLEEPNGANNAFIMTMGDLVAVEFSGASNAFYGYSVNRKLPFDLSKPVRTPVDGHNSLKNSARVLYLRHQDNVQGLDWEERFAAELKTHFGIQPGKAAPTRVVAQTATTPAHPVKLPSAPTEPTPSIRWTPPPRPQLVPEPDVPPPKSPAAPPVLALSTAGAPAIPSRVATPPPVIPAVAPPPPANRVFRLPPGTPSNVIGAKSNAQGVESILRSKAPGLAETKPPSTDKLPFSYANLDALAHRMGATVMDHTKDGGALWVLNEGVTTADARRLLMSWGFGLKPGKGWWIKPKP